MQLITYWCQPNGGESRRESQREEGRQVLVMAKLVRKGWQPFLVRMQTVGRVHSAEGFNTRRAQIVMEGAREAGSLPGINFCRHSQWSSGCAWWQLVCLLGVAVSWVGGGGGSRGAPPRHRCTPVHPRQQGSALQDCILLHSDVVTAGIQQAAQVLHGLLAEGGVVLNHRLKLLISGGAAAPASALRCALHLLPCLELLHSQQ